MSPEEIEFWQEVEKLAKPAPTFEYRIHYNDLGEIIGCTTHAQDHPDSTNYIVTDKETYTNYFLYKVSNGKLVKIEHTVNYNSMLTKNSSGRFKVVKDHANLLLENNEIYITTENYAYRNN
jgi:hypothetical protein